MLWQDWVFSIGTIIFAIALVPTLVSKNKPALSTSFTTGVVLLVFAITYVTLSLWFSAITTTITGTIWLIIFSQKYFSDKKPKTAS